MQGALQKLIPSARVSLNSEMKKIASLLPQWKGSDQNQTLPSVNDVSSGELVMLAPSILMAKKGDECKTLEQKKQKKETACVAPDLRPKEIPPYEYGFCKEPEKPLPMGCPPAAIRSKKGPCCHEDSGDSKKGGCRSK